MEMRRQKGEGTIREYEPGKWIASITINSKKHSFRGTSEKEVTKKLKDFKKKAEAGLISSSKISYSDFLDEWLDKKRKEIKGQSCDRIVSTVDTHIKPAIGFYNLDKLDPDTIQADVIDKTSMTKSYSTVKKIYDALNESLRYAKDKGLIIHNPVDLVTMPSQNSDFFQDNAKSNQNLEILTAEEIDRFTNVAYSTYRDGTPVFKNGRMFVFMLHTGVREGEATALKWTDYDEINQTIHVCNTMVIKRDKDDKRIFVDQVTTKSRNSERTLKINSKAISAIPITKSGKYIYCTSTGSPLRPRNVQNTLDSILNKAGIPHKSTHVFRHTYASMLFEKGVDVKVVSELLGHADVSTTYNTYITLIKKQKAKAMDAIDID